MAIWKKQPKPGDSLGAQVAQPKASPPIGIGTHSFIAGNGQHYVVAPGTGGRPHIGFKGRAPMEHPFAPAETFHLPAGGVNMPATTPLRATVPAVINSIAGQAAGTYQLAPGGGINMPATQKAPGQVGR